MQTLASASWLLAGALCLMFSVAAGADNVNHGTILGGKNATRGQFPWMVFITSAKSRPHYCGGSVIDKQWVLTSANCVEGAKHSDLLFGALHRVGAEPGKVEQRASTYFMHNYTGPNKGMPHNDIALIKLDKPLVWSDTIRPVKLPSRTQEDKDFADEKITISGWGKILNSNEELSKGLMFLEMFGVKDDVCFENQLICAHTFNGTVFRGDFGGPLVWKDTEDWRQIGVASIVYQNDVNLLDAFTAVARHLDWISKVTGIETGY